MDQIQKQFQEPPKIEKLLKGNDVAKLLNISRSFAYHLLQSGAIPVVRIGKSCRVKPQDLVEYIECNRHNQVDLP
jgi:excisionase family DNA binding protein